MTFGKLNERWILPDWLRPGDPSGLKLAVEQFDHALDEQIQRLLEGVKRMPDPMESAIGLPAQWSPASSTLIKARGSLIKTIRSSANIGVARGPWSPPVLEESSLQLLIPLKS
jgi:hypothetical protein